MSLQSKFSWTQNSSTDARAWTAVFSLLVSTTLGGIYFLFRTGFENPVAPVLSVLALNAWLTVTPFAMHLLFRKNEGDLRWYVSQSFLGLVTILTTFVLGWVSATVGNAVFIPFGVVAALAGILVCVRQFLRSRGPTTNWFVAAALLFSFWIAGVEWANEFLSPLFLEKVILHGGTSKVDTWYLSSLANMVQLTGAPSHGLDGIPPLQYHYGSGWLFAQFANLAGIPVLAFYNLGVPVVLVPLFLRSILVASADLKERPGTGVVSSVHNSPLIWALLAAATIGALPPAALHAVGVWESGPLLSESYVTAIAICLYAIATIVLFLRNWAVSPRRGRPQRHVLFMLLVFIPVMLTSIGMIKVSQMLLLGAAGAWFFFRAQLWRHRLTVASLIVTLLSTSLIYRHVVTAERTVQLSPFHFLEFLPASAWVFFPFVHLFWTWLYTLLRIYAERARTWKDVDAALREGRLRDVEFLVVIALAGLIPGHVVDLSSDQYYFSDFQRWVALTMLLGSPRLMALLGEWFSELRSNGTRLSKGSKTMMRVALVPFAFTIVLTALTWGARAVRDNLATRREVQGILGTLPETGLSSQLRTALATAVSGGLATFSETQIAPLFDVSSIDRALKRSPRYNIVTTLEALGDLSLNERKQSIVLIDPDLSAFWQLLPNAPGCIYISMVGPALTGMPLLQGIPPGCEIDVSQVGGNYRPSTSWKLGPRADDLSVCVQAREKGFTRVLKVLPSRDEKVRIVPLNCRTLPSANLDGTDILEAFQNLARF